MGTRTCQPPASPFADSCLAIRTHDQIAGVWVASQDHPQAGLRYYYGRINYLANCFGVSRRSPRWWHAVDLLLTLILEFSHRLIFPLYGQLLWHGLPSQGESTIHRSGGPREKSDSIRLQPSNKISVVVGC